MTGALYLIPVPLGPVGEIGISPSVRQMISTLDGVIAESNSAGSRFLKQAGMPDIHKIPIRLLNEHTRPDEIQDLIAPLLRGERWGLVSDAGAPAVADPGAELVLLAHQKGVRVSPIPGPSSPILALMASGLNGQQFAFHGYLPREKSERRKKLKDLESSSGKFRRTEIWMETPYRNAAVFEDALAVLDPRTFLCVAADLTFPTEEIRTQSIGGWKSGPKPELKNRPAIFLIGKP